LPRVAEAQVYERLWRGEESLLGLTPALAFCSRELASSPTEVATSAPQLKKERAMSQEADDKGLAAVVLERLENERLPRALELKEKVDAGARLDDMDIAFLERVFADTEDLKPLVARHPEYHQLAARLVGLYEHITSKALENEKAG
jgi:hypothetical protein